jgi:hypothetical protein
MQRVASLLACLVTLAPLPAAGQEGLGTTRRDAEVMNYRLSMDKLHQLLEVQRALTAANEKNPEFFTKIDEEAMAAAKANGGPLTVAQKVAILERHPEFQRVVAGAGGNARDWMLTLEAFGSAYVTVHSRDGTLAGPPPTTAAEKANVALLDQNADESERIMEELGKLADEMIE